LLKIRRRYALKKLIIIITMALLLLSAGCNKEDGESTASATTPSPTDTPAAEPSLTPSPTPVTTKTPIATTEPIPTPSPTPQPQGYVYVADGFCYYELTDGIKQRITGMSYPAEGSDEITCDDLRYIELLHYDFDGEVRQGELIVNAQVAQEVTEIFYELYLAQYPLTSVILVDDFGEPGDDNLSMAANNTSAFNYRYVTGTKKLSRHSYGAAIDINPKLNPYIDGDRIVPENGKQYADRSLDEPGMIDHDDLCYKLFTEHGWTWGGDWSGDKDYQHFSKDLGY